MRMMRLALLLVLVLWGTALPGRGLRDRLKGLVFEVEDWSKPKKAWCVNDDAQGTRWNLWTTEEDVWSKRSNGQSLKTPVVKADRKTPDEGAPVLHTRIKGIPRGFYQVFMNNTNRLLAISQDGGRTWRPSQPGNEEFLGMHEIKDGVFEVWVDDRYATPGNIGSAYYDYIRMVPSAKPELQGLTAHRLPDGRTMMSWLSSVPLPAATVRYRRVGGNWKEAKEGESHMRNHYVRLPELADGAVYEAQVVCALNASQTLKSGKMTFETAPAQASGSGAEVALEVREPSGTGREAWPVRSGVPLAQGTLAGAGGARLLDASGHEVPAQFEVMGRWPDGSVKWLVTTFCADTKAGEASRYTLRLAAGGEASEASGAAVPVHRMRSLTAPFLGAVARLALSDGSVLTSRLDESQAAFARGFAQVEGTFRDGTGQARFRWRLELRCYPGAAEQSDARFTVRNCDFRAHTALVRSLSLTMPAGEWLNGAVRLSDGVELSRGGKVTQVTYGNSELSRPGKAVERRGNFAGWLSLGDGSALLLRNFWQTYPKGVELGEGGLTWWLLPELPRSNYPPEGWDKLDEEVLHWFWYDRATGCYRFRQGVEVAHEFVYRRGPGAAARPEVMSTRLFAQASTEHYCSSKAFGDVLPYAPERYRDYEEAFAQSFRNLERGRHELRQEYGWMSFGDWFGERHWNWGNNEYDLPYAMAMHFARTGRLELLERGAEMARHYATVDVCHEAPLPLRERVYGHCMGHVGLFYQRSDPRIQAVTQSGKRFVGMPGAMHDSGHAHLPGLFFYACLLGDRSMYDTAVQCAWTQAQRYTPNFSFGIERSAGWPLINATYAYRFTGNPYFLQAARIYFEKIRSTQNPETGCFDLPQDQTECDCPDKAQHRGGKAFATGVLMHGLARLWECTGDEQVKDTLVRCADWLIDIAWNEERQGFRYKTGCPKYANQGWYSIIVTEGIAYATELTGNRRYIEFLERTVGRQLRRTTGSGRSSGKDFTQFHRHIPHLLYYLHKNGIDDTAEFARPVPREQLLLVGDDGRGTLALEVANPWRAPRPCTVTVGGLEGCRLVEGSHPPLSWEAAPGVSRSPGLEVALTGERGRLTATVELGGVRHEVAVQVRRRPAAPRLGTATGFVGSEDSFTLSALRRHGLKATVLAAKPEAWELDGLGCVIVGGDAFSFGKRPPRRPSAYDMARLLSFVEAGGLVVCFQLNDTDWPAVWGTERLEVVEPESRGASIAEPGHWLLAGVGSLAGQRCYDRIESASPGWRVLARDDRGRPCGLSLRRGAGELVVFLPNVDRVYAEPQAMSMSVADCARILENVVRRCAR